MNYTAVTVMASLLAALGPGCASSSADDDSPLPAPTKGEGFQLKFEIEVDPGSEAWKCQISEIPTVGFYPVNRAESVQSEGMHHMDVLALEFTGLDLENGVYDCKELYAAHAELMEDGIFLYASQMPEQVIQLPEGVVANLPQGIQVMQEIHFVNTTDEPVSAFSAVNVYRYEGEQSGDIWGYSIRDTQLEIPPNSNHEEWTRCVMSEDIDVLYLASHTHQLGREVEIRLFDGTDVGEPIYRNTNWESPELLSFNTKPLHIPAGTGFEFRCKFSNTTEKAITWGFAADDEMCQMALVYTPGDPRRVCTPVDSSDGKHDLPVPPG